MKYQAAPHSGAVFFAKNPQGFENLEGLGIVLVLRVGKKIRIHN